MVSVRRLVLIAAIGAIAALAWPGAALAATSVTLAFTGGKPAISGPLGVQTFAWGTAAPGSHTGGYTGRARVRSQSVSGGEFVVTMVIDKNSPKLAQESEAGSHFDTVTAAMTRDGDASAYLDIQFSQVFVAGISIDSTDGGKVPTESVTFAYTSVQVQYMPQTTCSIGSKSWQGLSQLTPAVDPGTGGNATDPMQEFLPVQLGSSGPGVVNVSDPNQADSLLGANGANGILNLRAQTLATRLNVGSGALDPSSVSSQLSQSDALLGTYKPGRWGSLDPTTQASIEQLVTQLQGANTPASGCPALPQSATLVQPTVFSLGGLVTDACTGAPVQGLTANLMTPGLPGPINLTTNHSEFAGLTIPAGQYQLTVNGDGHSAFSLPVQVPAVQGQPVAGAFTGGLDVAIAMSRPGGCPPGSKQPGPPGIPALSGGLYDACTLHALDGGTASLVLPAGGTIPTTMLENGFSLGQLNAGSYGVSEAVAGYQSVMFTGGVLPAVQMPVQPSVAADGSGARFSIIIVAEPAPVGAVC